MTRQFSQFCLFAVLAGAAFLLGGVGRAHADLVTITTDDGSGADSLVYSGNPAVNYGTLDHVLAKHADWSTLHRKAYTRFDLSALGGLDVIDATLTLVAIADINGAATFNVFGLNDGAAGQNWGETTITWNNAPANNTSSGYALTSDATLLGQFTVPYLPDPQTITFSNASLASFLNNDTDNLATLVVTRQTGSNGLNTGRFASREHSSLAPPTLEVNVNAVPEPSTLILFGTGAVSFLAYGWRRLRKRKPST